MADELIASLNGEVSRTSDALAITLLVEDVLGWDSSRRFIEQLPVDVASDPSIRQRELLAIGKLGNNDMAAAGLTELIDEHGATSDRWAMVGGRYKDAWRVDPGGPMAEQYLLRSIDAYEQGMATDPNDYYPSSNLPNLYRSLSEPAETAALLAVRVAMAACQRAIDAGTADEWVRPTLLGLAFASADVSIAEQFATEVMDEEPAQWKLETTVDDLEVTVELLESTTKAQLMPILHRLTGFAAKR